MIDDGMPHDWDGRPVYITSGPNFDFQRHACIGVPVTPAEGTIVSLYTTIHVQ
jgi:hypothetical protein